jgi:transglutaminase-like putative cysteine protease
MVALLVISAVIGARSLYAAHSAATPADRTFDLIYRFTLQDLPAGASQITAWAPMPQSDQWQIVEEFSVNHDRPYKIVGENEYGNRFIRLDLSETSREAEGEVEVALKFRVKRHAYSALDISESDIEQPSSSMLARFLLPDTMIPIGGKIAEESKSVVGDVEDPLQRARLLYDHIVRTISYDKSGKGWGRGDALYACDVRAGNCTDFHSLFIGEARALGIPARFIMGLPIADNASEGSISGYHCWAEFYIEGKGWIPIDASEAHKYPEKKEALFGGLDAHRIAFTIGRDIRIPGTSGELQNYIIYPHVEVDGRPYSKMSIEFHFSEVSG